MTTTEQQPLLTYHCPHCNATVGAHPEADKVTVCPACHQAFEAALPLARPDTPAAGILLPPGVEPPAQPAPQAVPVAQPAATLSAPAPPPQPALPPESAGELIHVSAWRRYPIRCLAYVAAIIACCVLAIWLLNLNYQIVAGICGVVLLFLAFRFGTWMLRMYNTTLIITDRRCVIETGLFSREATEIGRRDVTDVFIAQDPIMRILDVGDLVIRSDSGSRKEIVLMAVPHPDEVMRKINPPPPPPAHETAAAQATSA